LHACSAETVTCPECGHPVALALAAADALAKMEKEEGKLNGKLPPELLEWARQTFDEEEFRAGMREIEETGGLELKDFIQELEQEVSSRE
jgi:hypothetical protein